MTLMQSTTRGLYDDWQPGTSGLYLPPPPRQPEPSGLLVPAGREQQPRPIAIGLFAGAGGMDLGFTYAGFHVAAAVEFDLTASATYLCNLGGPRTRVFREQPDGSIARIDTPADAGTGWVAGSRERHAAGEACPEDPCAACCDARPCDAFWIADVRKLTGGQILDELGLQPGDVTCVTGGPPCQGFSRAGARNVMDPRNSLVFDFARLVLEIRPKTFVMENVVGMLDMVTPEGVPVIDAFCRVIADGGFSDYNALRRSLYSSAGAGAALRREGKSAAARDAEDVDDAEPTLWDAES